MLIKNWVKVTDFIPNEGDIVLICIETKLWKDGTEYSIDIGCICNQKWEVGSDSYVLPNTQKVTHWMKLPEFPIDLIGQKFHYDK